MTDWSLLRQYLDAGSQAAFSKLVDRRMKLVYWTCRRDLKDDQLAEDATQAVFVLLVRKAPSFNKSVSVSSWLFQAARFVSRDMIRREVNRRRYEEEAGQIMGRQNDAEDHWPRLELRLNEAIAALPAADREAVLLRYFEGLSLRELSQEIGATEEAARKRVARALERLRRYLARKEVAVTSAALAALLIAHPAKAVPAAAQSATHATVGQMMAGHAPAYLSSLLFKKGADLIMQTIRAKAFCAIIAVVIALLVTGGIKGWKRYHARLEAASVAPGFTDLTAASASANDPTTPDRQAIADQLRRITEGFNHRDVSVLRSSLAPNGSFDQRPGDPPVSAAKNLADLQQSFSTHPDMRIATSLVYANIQRGQAMTHMLSVANTTTVPGDGEVVGKHITSRQMVIQQWAKEGGKWLLTSWYVQR